jgi:hypothetical protein
MMGNLIIDGRNIFDAREMAENGFYYVGVGKGTTSGGIRNAA